MPPEQDPQQDPVAAERLALLERRIERLERRLARRRRPARRDPAAAARRAARFEHGSEQWLGRAGLVLLFLGLVYLFQYSIEQGWITPVVRVAIGLSIASALLALGSRLGPARRSFAQILLAGAVAAYYVSGWAAFDLYALVGHTVALLYMTGVMALALSLSLRKEQPALASLGAAGGFATPLLLRGDAVPVVELAVYATLVVVWASAVFARRGWHSLLWSYSVGALATLALAVRHATGGERPVVLAALLLAWAMAGAFPFLRGWLRGEEAERGALLGLLSYPLQLRALGVGASTATLLLVDRLWSLGDRTTGLLFLALALLYALFALAGTRRESVHARAAAPVAAALVATGSYLLVADAGALVALLSLQAYLYVVLGRGPRFAGVEWVGHTLFALLALDLARETLFTEWVFLDRVALGQAVQIALTLVASFHLRDERAAWTYRIGAHLLALVWLGKELSPVSSERATVTVAWGAYGAILLVLALRLRDRRAAPTTALQLVALSALALAVGKLIAVDLVRVALLWRVFLFMGFGAGLLALSSMLRPGELPDSRRGVAGGE